MSKLNEKVLNYIETTGEALGVAMKIAEAQAAAQEKVAGLADILKTTGLIEDHEVKSASDQLANHGQTLDILANVITHYQGQLKEAQAKTASLSLGSGDSESTPAKPINKFANYAGYRRGDDDGPSESDQALLRLIDGYQPGA